MLTTSIFSSSKKIIYDFGANNGDDIPYYLKKADTIVAVEANPALTMEMERKYFKEINEGRLFIENCVVTSAEISGVVPFYMHKHGHIISQFPKPAESELINFDKVHLPSKSVADLIKRYGYPYYVKIDIEGYDHEIIRALFENGIFPEYISAESHSIEVFALLAGSHFYKSFNLIDGASVEKKYKNSLINTANGKEQYSFPRHSAGPFGEDIRGEWMTSQNFFQRLAYEGLGWKDIHATNRDLTNPSRKVDFSNYAKAYLLRKITPKILRSFLKNKLGS
jgi:FkbM family methyltransferase